MFKLPSISCETFGCPTSHTRWCSFRRTLLRAPTALLQQEALVVYDHNAKFPLNIDVFLLTYISKNGESVERKTLGSKGGNQKWQNLCRWSSNYSSLGSRAVEELDFHLCSRHMESISSPLFTLSP